MTMVTPLSHCGLVKYETGSMENKLKCLLVFMCVCVCVHAHARKDVCSVQSGLNLKICEPMLHVVAQAQYVEGVLQGVVRVDPMCMKGVFATQVVLGQSNLVRTSREGEEGRDKRVRS